MKTLTPDDIFEFGKNKGLKLSYVYKYQPSYLEWAIEKIDSFKIDIEAFELLPNPTPIFYNKQTFGDSRQNKEIEEISMEELFSLLEKSDSLNRMKAINANKIEELIESKDFECKEIIYRFPERIRKINDEK